MTDLRDSEGRRWKILRSLSHDSEAALLVERSTGGPRRRVGRCRIRFAGPYAEIVSQGLGEIEEEEQHDGSIRTTRVPPRGEVVGLVRNAVDVDRLRRRREEMLRGTIE